MTPNINIERKGADLVITVKNVEKADFGLSASGKNSTLASTHGNTDVSSAAGRKGARLGLNLYAPPA